MRRWLRTLPLLLAAGIAATLFVAWASIGLVDLSTATLGPTLNSYDGRVTWLIDRSSGPAALRIVVKRRWGQPWNVEQACGPPNSRGGDERTAWASDPADGTAEWLELGYDRPIQPAAIHVYENYNPGAVVNVTIWDDATGEEEVVWRGKPNPRQPSNQAVAVHRLELPITTMKRTRRVRLDLDSAAVPGWNEIDAVGLIDSTGTASWATRARASTTYQGGKDGQDVSSRLPYWCALPPVPSYPNAGENQTDERTIEGRGWPMAALRAEVTSPALPPHVTGPIWRGFLIDTLFFTALAAALYWLANWPRRFLIESARLRRGCCMQCGYELHFDFAKGCPECGWRR
jgi:hypothetical protein